MTCSAMASGSLRPVSQRLMVGSETLRREASCSWVRSRRLRRSLMSALTLPGMKACYKEHVICQVIVRTRAYATYFNYFGGVMP